MNAIILIAVTLIISIVLIAFVKTIKNKSNGQYTYRHHVMKIEDNKRKLCTETVRVESFTTAFLLNIIDVVTYAFILLWP